MFFEKLRCGNAEAEKVWDDYLKYLAIAINNLRMTFDCDIIAGGYVGAFLEEFARELKNYVAERNTFESNADFLKYCTFKLEASAVGAALMKIDSFLQEI
jgi:predicted NBD/HSP70 family sugar kinase